MNQTILETYVKGFIVETYKIIFFFFIGNQQDDLTSLKKKLLFQLVSNFYNVADQSERIKKFLKKHVSY
jgi:hypothetical protein